MIQLCLFLPGSKVLDQWGRVLVVAEDQTPISGLEWLHGPATIYVISQRQRIPVYRYNLNGQG